MNVFHHMLHASTQLLQRAEQGASQNQLPVQAAFTADQTESCSCSGSHTSAGHTLCQQLSSQVFIISKLQSVTR